MNSNCPRNKIENNETSSNHRVGHKEHHTNTSSISEMGRGDKRWRARRIVELSSPLSGKYIEPIFGNGAVFLRRVRT